MDFQNWYDRLEFYQKLETSAQPAKLAQKFWTNSQLRRFARNCVQNKGLPKSLRASQPHELRNLRQKELKLSSISQVHWLIFFKFEITRSCYRIDTKMFFKLEACKLSWIIFEIFFKILIIFFENFYELFFKIFMDFFFSIPLISSCILEKSYKFIQKILQFFFSKKFYEFFSENFSKFVQKIYSQFFGNFSFFFFFQKISYDFLN